LSVLYLIAGKFACCIWTSLTHDLGIVGLLRHWPWWQYIDIPLIDDDFLDGFFAWLSFFPIPIEQVSAFVFALPVFDGIHWQGWRVIIAVGMLVNRRMRWSRGAFHLGWHRHGL
jgi:hypothetical protein